MQTHEQQDCATITTPRAERIAQLNDLIRKTGIGGRIMVTSGVRALPGFNVLTLMAALAAYDGFSDENDPHGERDFGDFEYCGASLFFKIDYYAPDMRFGSADPADPNVTLRILTVMLVSEY